MPSNNNPLSDEALEVYEAQRDIAADLLQATAEMKAGQGRIVISDEGGRGSKALPWQHAMK